MAQPIIFYDITNGCPSGSQERCWTPNPLKTRLVLNYKEIPYRTIWVDFADVQPLSKQIGAPPTTAYSDGRPRYTLPTIHDPNTGRTVSDSLKIALYLDEQYPQRKIFLAGSEDAQAEFANVARTLVSTVTTTFCMYASWINLGDDRNRNAMSKKFPTFFPSPPVIDGTKPVSEDILQGISPLVDALEATKRRAGLGEDIAYVDICAMAYLRWLQISLEDKEQFNTLLQINNGNCKALYDKFKEYLTVDEGEKAVLKE